MRMPTSLRDGRTSVLKVEGLAGFACLAGVVQSPGETPYGESCDLAASCP